MKRIQLTSVPSVLLERNYTQRPLSYKRLYSAALDQRIPAKQGENGRWSVDEADLPLIAEELCGAMAA